MMVVHLQFGELLKCVEKQLDEGVQQQQQQQQNATREIATSFTGRWRSLAAASRTPTSVGASSSGVGLVLCGL